jgi:hypothetical protein
MPKVPWSSLLPEEAHLIVAELPPVEDDPAIGYREARVVMNLLMRATTKLAPDGRYTMTINRQGRTAEIHWAFKRESDAAKLGDAVRARLEENHLGWLSKRTVQINRSVVKAIERILEKDGEDA